jgi:hypothetical protein
MPEFILDHGDAEGQRWFNSLDLFTQGYVEAMFFTSTGSGDDGELEDASTGMLAEETRKQIEGHCKSWQASNADLLSLAYERAGYDEAQAGRDLWYTEQGHGVGFKDREPLEMGDLGGQLEKAAGHRSTYVYLGDDSLIYLS